MRVIVTHGPDRDPLVAGPDNVLVSRWGVPFHGIPSRAAVTWLAATGSDWHGQHPQGVPTPALRALEVLTLTESAGIATSGLARIAGGSATEPPAGSELWNVKEGHTSSVWFARLPGGDRCVVNVGRDPQASAELAAVTERLRTLAFDPARVAGVLDGFWIERAGTTPDGGPLQPVYVAVQELVEEAQEIHRIGRRYAIVERFLADPSRPSLITSVRGRWAIPAEARAIDRLRRDFDRAGAPHDLALTINDGDLVWAPGRGPVVVAAGLRSAQSDPDVDVTGIHAPAPVPASLPSPAPTQTSRRTASRAQDCTTDLISRREVRHAAA